MARISAEIPLNQIEYLPEFELNTQPYLPDGLRNEGDYSNSP